MSLTVHLSDLHFGEGARWQGDVLEGLLGTLETIGQRPGLLLLTGDVMDTSTPAAEVLDGLVRLLARVDAVLGGEVPTVLVPGNHDRRGDGVFAPWSSALFDELARRLASRPHVRVTGLTAPFLATPVPLDGFPADVVAYDSTYLPRGLLSAGGLVRREDLLQVASRLPPADGTRPLFFVLHHHLVPTPITDTLLVDTDGRPLLQRLLVEQLLPDLVANGDREELTMTALGAGTALTTLAQLGRPVVVLHGHKHYPVARLLKGVGADEADVLVASAGSCGTATGILGAELDDAPRLWPSLNLLHLTESSLRVETLAWSPWAKGRRNPPRPLVHVRRAGRRWDLVHDVPRVQFSEAVMAENVADVTLRRSRTHLDRYDVEVRRRLVGLPVARVTEYVELVVGPPGARLQDVRLAGLPGADGPVPAKLSLPLTGTASWTVLGGAVVSTGEALTAFGRHEAWDWVGLLNRSRATVASLSLDVSAVKGEPFASATDLTTGTERPVPLTREGSVVRVEVRDCPARTLLRILWPLEVS